MHSCEGVGNISKKLLHREIGELKNNNGTPSKILLRSDIFNTIEFNNHKWWRKETQTDGSIKREMKLDEKISKNK